MTHNKSQDISVQSDGIKIGWNIMATLAAMGIGMYVYAVLAPIKSNIESMLVTLTKIEKFNEAVDDRVDKCTIKGVVLDQRLRVLENNR